VKFKDIIIFCLEIILLFFIIFLLIILLNGGKYTPNDYIKPNDIIIYPNGVFIKINNSQEVEFLNTGSMFPVFHKGHTAIQYKPKNESELFIGDIISFKNNQNKSVTHRIIKIYKNETNINKYITKGDNNLFKDKDEIIFDNIEGKIIIIIY
jgi:signal peptidase I